MKWSRTQSNPLCAAIVALLLVGCATRREGSYAPVYVRGAGANPRLNNVGILDRSIAGKVAVQGSGAERTDAGTLRVWAQFRNRTEFPLEIRVRVQFFDESGAPVEEPHTWQTVFLPPNAIQTWRALSKEIHTPASYYIEVMEAR